MCNCASLDYGEYKLACDENTRLRARNAELLAALKSLADECDRLKEGEDGLHDPSCVVCASVVRARAAIAAAEEEK